MFETLSLAERDVEAGLVTHQLCAVVNRDL
jgi:hypothetical protein